MVEVSILKVFDRWAQREFDDHIKDADWPINCYYYISIIIISQRSLVYFLFVIRQNLYIFYVLAPCLERIPCILFDIFVRYSVISLRHVGVARLALHSVLWLCFVPIHTRRQ